MKDPRVAFAPFICTSAGLWQGKKWTVSDRINMNQNYILKA